MAPLLFITSTLCCNRTRCRLEASLQSQSAPVVDMAPAEKNAVETTANYCSTVLPRIFGNFCRFAPLPLLPIIRLPKVSAPASSSRIIANISRARCSRSVPRAVGNTRPWPTHTMRLSSPTTWRTSDCGDHAQRAVARGSNCGTAIAVPRSTIVTTSVRRSTAMSTRLTARRYLQIDHHCR